MLEIWHLLDDKKRVSWCPVIGELYHLITVSFARTVMHPEESLVQLKSFLPFCIAKCGILPSLRILKLPIPINHVYSKFIRMKLDFQFPSSIHQEKHFKLVIDI